MNKKMKALSLLLVGMMSMSALVGCGGKQEAVSVKTDTAETTKKKEVVNLVWWMIGTEPTELAEVNQALNTYTAEKIGVTIDIKYASWGEYSEKLSKIIQSGESYDMAFGAGIKNYQDLASKDYFADLSPILATETPALWE
ncbi:MAG: extracellular solute-binding protein, partial [Niameybacter sp.]